MHHFPQRDLKTVEGRLSKKADDLYNSAYAEGVTPAQTRNILRKCRRYRELAMYARLNKKSK